MNNGIQNRQLLSFALGSRHMNIWYQLGEVVSFCGFVFFYCVYRVRRRKGGCCYYFVTVAASLQLVGIFALSLKKASE